MIFHKKGHCGENDMQTFFLNLSGAMICIPAQQIIRIQATGSFTELFLTAEKAGSGENYGLV